MRKLKKGDTVIVLTGKDRTKRGEIILVLPKVNRVLVKNINMIKKHVKGNPSQNEKGGIVEKESSIHISNVAIFNAATGKRDRVGVKFLEDGRKVRYFKSTGEIIDI